jgi:hypothetical protein
VVAGHPFRWASQQEKEARLVLKELWAKLDANQRFVAYGVGAVVVGWIAGLILGSQSNCGTVLGSTYCVGSVNYFSFGNAGLFGILALVLAIVVGVALYIKVAPNMSFTWPMPFAQILLGGCVAVLVCGALMTLIQFTNGGNPPALMYVADVLVVGGGVVMAWFSYQDFLVSKSVV